MADQTTWGLNGTVWAWGWNRSGELGDGTTTDQLTPVQLSGLTDVTAITTGPSSTYALKSDGTVWAWGDNSSGELGDGTTIERPTPVQVIGLTGVTAVVAQSGSVFALRSDGTVWAWGLNGYATVGQARLAETVILPGGRVLPAGTIVDEGYQQAVGGFLGDGTAIERPTPVQVIGLTGVAAIAAGHEAAYALKSDGTVWAWGRNGRRGILGDGSTDERLTPLASA